MPANLENSAVATGLEKVNFHSNPKERQCQRLLNFCTIALISHASKVMLKILQARLQQYMNCELPNTQAGFRKGRGTRDQVANICWIIKRAREFQNSIYFCPIDYAKAFDCVNHNKLKNSWRDGNTRPPDLPLEKSVLQVRKQHLELDMEQQERQTCFKSGKEYVNTIYCHSAYLTYIRVYHVKCRAGWSTSCNQDCWEKYQ